MAESLRLGRASKLQQKSLKSHIAWLDKRIEDLDTDPKGPDAAKEMIRFFYEHPRCEAAERTYAERGYLGWDI